MMAKKGAFTLVELLVVILIMGVIGTVVVASFAGGMRAYERVYEFGSSEAEACLALEFLERDLKNAVNLRKFPFQGESQVLQFAALRAVPSQAEDDGEVVLLRYWYDPQGGLQRSVAPLDDEGFLMDGESVADRSVKVTFAYGDSVGAAESSWEDKWQSVSNLPSRVLVRFESAEEEYGTIVERGISLPAAVNNAEQ